MAPPAAEPPAFHDFGRECAPGDVGLDGGALDRLRPLLQGWVSSGRMPMATALVARRGKVAWWGGCGEQNPGKQISADTLYRIYSMTKPVTAVAIMMLVEDGKIHLDMPVHLFLGQSWHKKNMKVFVGGTKDDPKLEPCKKSVTIKHLLMHMSGLTYGFAGAELVNPVAGMYQDRLGRIPTSADSSQRVTQSVAEGGAIRVDSPESRPASAASPADPAQSGLQRLTEKLASLPLCFQPGAKWHYGFNYEVLGRVVEVVSGVPFAEFLERRIFAPLGMRDTGFSVPAEKVDRFASCWFANLQGDTVDISSHQRQGGEFVAGKVKVAAGGGGLVSTMRDYFCFAQCMLNGGLGPNGTRILSRRTVEWMVCNQLPGNTDMASISLPGYTEMSSPGVGFGLGFSTVLDPPCAGENVGAGTFGWGGLAATVFYCDPVEQLCVIFMTQVIGLNLLQVPTRLLLSNVAAGALADGALGAGALGPGAGARSRL